MAQVTAMRPQNFLDGARSSSIRTQSVDLRPQSGSNSQVSFSEAMQVLFSGAQGQGQSAQQVNNHHDFSNEFKPAQSENEKVRAFAALENPPTVSDFKMLEQNPASGSDFSILDALGDGLMFAAKIAGAVMAF